MKISDVLNRVFGGSSGPAASTQGRFSIGGMFGGIVKKISSLFSVSVGPSRGSTAAPSMQKRTVAPMNVAADPALAKDITDLDGAKVALRALKNDSSKQLPALTWEQVQLVLQAAMDDKSVEAVEITLVLPRALKASFLANSNLADQIIPYIKDNPTLFPEDPKNNSGKRLAAIQQGLSTASGRPSFHAGAFLREPKK